MDMNIVKLTPDAAAHFIVDCWNAGLVPGLIGGSGLGKDYTVRAAKDLAGLGVASDNTPAGGLLEFRNAEHEPVEIGGFPSPQADGPYVDYKPPLLMPYEDRDDIPETGVVFFNEFSKGLEAMMNACSNPLEYARAAGRAFKPGWRMVIAANRPGIDRSGDNRIPGHMIGRIVFVEVVNNLKAWIDWAGDAGMHPDVIGFMMWKRGERDGEGEKALFDVEASRDRFVTPQPRKWEMVSKMCWSFDDMPAASTTIELASFAGAVGLGLGEQFQGYRRMMTDLPTIGEIEADPSNTRLPERQAGMIAISALLAKQVEQANTQAVLTYIDRLDGDDCRVLFAMVLGRRFPAEGRTEESDGSPFETPDMGEWMARHAIAA